ncbi:MAG: protein phosphatase 2C domain-containing protein [Gordonia sp. (in: high G+C Gram-positive bacteria)]|uniref:PP2C family protein-serine/threonine phosphatase n=1 Tax=Gordonia sp. (in: high G+C Gram-positive bacteria) TaxID=84139 RepID=UPI0039E54F4F
MSAPGFVRDDVAAGLDEIGGLRLEWAVACNVGSVREANEDGALVRPGTYLLADGMGGHDCGEVASEIALDVLSRVDTGGEQDATREAVDALLVEAQDKIGDVDTSSERRAGTTATGAVLIERDGSPHWLVFNIGDSRTYCVRDGVLEQVTVDHSQVQEFVDAGMMTPEQARVDARRNVITRALGGGMEPPRADFFVFATEPGDQLMLCSDGLTGELPDPEIADILADAETAQDAVDNLVEGALALGGHDNITVVLVRVAAGDAADDNTGDDDAVDDNTGADEAGGDEAGGDEKTDADA